MEQMRGKWASSCVDFGYTELFCIPELTSEFISSCDSVLGDSLVIYQENRGSICVYWGIRYCSARNAGESGLISQRAASLHLRCWWKVGSNLQSKTGNHISSWDDMGYMELSSSCCTDINIHIDLRRVSQGPLSIPQGSQATCTVCCGTRDSYGANEGEMGFILC